MEPLLSDEEDSEMDTSIQSLGEYRVGSVDVKLEPY